MVIVERNQAHHTPFAKFAIVGCILFSFVVAVNPPRWLTETFNSQEAKRTAAGLVCYNATWDMGVINYATMNSPNASHDFEVFNSSDGEMEIDVESSCGCVVPAGYSSNLKPGDSTKISVMVRISPTPGDFRQVVLVRVGRESEMSLPLLIRGKIENSLPLSSAPRVVNFGKVFSGERKQRSVIILNYGSSCPKLRVRCNEAAIVCKWAEPEGETDCSVPKLVIALDAAYMPSHEFSSKIELLAEVDAVPVLTIPVVASLDPAGSEVMGNTDFHR